MKNVQIETVLNEAKNLGLDIMEFKNLYKIFGAMQRKSLYVFKSVRQLRRIDCIGFVPEEHEAINMRWTSDEAKTKGLGSIRARIFVKTLPENVDVLEGFRVATKSLMDGGPGFSNITKGTASSTIGAPEKQQKAETPNSVYIEEKEEEIDILGEENKEGVVSATLSSKKTEPYGSCEDVFSSHNHYDKVPVVENDFKEESVTKIGIPFHNFNS